MTHADYQSDSSTDGYAAQSVTPAPPPLAPPAAASIEAPPRSSSPVVEETPPIPPPPPPRSTLPPVRSSKSSFEPVVTEQSAPVPSGLGSAKSSLWRGELPGFRKRKRKDAGTTEAGTTGADPTDVEQKEGKESGEDEEAASAEEIIKRSAPPWLVSTVIHLVLLLVLALISTPAGESFGRMMLEIGSSEGTEDVDLAEFSIEASEIPVLASEMMVESESQVDAVSIFDDFNDADTPENSSVQVGLGPAVEIAKPMFNGRSGAMKQTLLSLYGGTPKTQDAVQLGLAWVARNQLSDGSWSLRGPYSDVAVAENKPAATAMALLAFLGDGNTHQSGPYAKNVDRGVKYLVSQQSRNGFMAKSARGHQQAYAQAQASIVLCELYAMTQDSWLRDKAQAAIDYAQEAQAPEGGWRYYPKTDSDTSVTGWFVMLLQSGMSAQLEVDRSVLYKVENYLDAAQTDDGAAYAYQPRGRTNAAMSAEGLLCRQYLGWQRNHPQLERGLENLWIQDPFSMNDQDVYYWYYATQVLHHYGGEPWNRWNKKMREELPDAQVKSGRERGSWDPQGDRWGDYGRLYTTCLSIFCLEVYYRHMPLYMNSN